MQVPTSRAGKDLRCPKCDLDISVPKLDPSDAAIVKTKQGHFIVDAVRIAGTNSDKKSKSPNEVVQNSPLESNNAPSGFQVNEQHQSTIVEPIEESINQVEPKPADSSQTPPVLQNEADVLKSLGLSDSKATGISPSDSENTHAAKRTDRKSRWRLTRTVVETQKKQKLAEESKSEIVFLEDHSPHPGNVRSNSDQEVSSSGIEFVDGNSGIKPTPNSNSRNQSSSRKRRWKTESSEDVLGPETKKSDSKKRSKQVAAEKNSNKEKKVVDPKPIDKKPTEAVASTADRMSDKVAQEHESGVGSESKLKSNQKSVSKTKQGKTGPTDAKKAAFSKGPNKDVSSKTASDSRANKAKPETEAEPDDQSELVGIHHDWDTRVRAVYLSIALFLIGIGTLFPVCQFVLESNNLDELVLPNWANWLVVIGSLHIVYSFYIFQLADWTSARIVTLYLLCSTAVFAVVLSALILSEPTGLVPTYFSIPASLNQKAILWVLTMLSTTALLGYMAGKMASGWKRKEDILRSAISD